MAPHARVALGALAALLTVTGAVPAAGAGERLTEAATCATPTPLPAVGDERSDGATTVHVQVPSVTRLRVRDGRVVAASTNTGCAPRPGDTFVAGNRRATRSEIARALGVFRTGDWTAPGRWHRAR